MALEPITRQEKIIAGQDLTPITRLEMFLKNFGGGGGGSVPKPLTYDYMPEGYPRKSVETVTVMEEQVVAFASEGDAGQYTAHLTEAFELVVGQTYTVNWDGTEYECVCSAFNSVPVLGNLSLFGVGDDTGEPFLYISATTVFVTLATSASHTISITTMGEVITPIDERYLPEIPAGKLPAIPAIHFTTNISANIANETPPVFGVNGLSYSEIYNIAEKGSFLIEDTGTERYIPIKLDISQSGDIFVDIMVIGSAAIYARLACRAGETRFSRYAWWQIETTKK